MIVRKAWNQLASSLNACEATKQFAASLELIRIDGGILHLSSRDLFTKSATSKLCRALSKHTGQAITLVLRHAKTGVTQRAYSETGE